MENQEELIDKKVYKQASKRVTFKFHVAIFILSVSLLWVVYAFVFKENEQFFKVALFISLIWTIIVCFHYLFVYRLDHSLLDKEIKKVQREIAEKEKKLEQLHHDNNQQN